MSEEACEIPAGRGEGEDFLAALGVRIGHERADEIGFEGFDEALADAGFVHCVSLAGKRRFIPSPGGRHKHAMWRSGQLGIELWHGCADGLGVIYFLAIADA